MSIYLSPPRIETLVRGLDLLNTLFSAIVAALEPVVFFEIAGMPLLVLWIVGAGIFFTLRMGFINIRGFKHAWEVLWGKYDNGEEAGEVSHFQAIATSLSATVGLGNIAGVAIAIELGGPGTIFWMTMAGILGMSVKFVECTLGLKYRHVKPDGTVAGGPPYYLSQGLAQLGLGKLGHILAVIFAICCMGSTLGAGNMFQANQSFAALAAAIPAVQNLSWLYGLILSAIAGLVIVGGISRIGTVTSRLVPAMLGVYVAACLWIVFTHLTDLPMAVRSILREAFLPQAVGGGIIGVLVQGLRRSIFSNGAGSGQAAIAHAAARTTEPIRQGILASLEPFIDTVIICNLTAIAILVTGVYGNSDPETANGITLTAEAFRAGVNWFPLLLAGVVLLFSFSTIISFSYYGEQCWGYLFGDRTTLVYKLLFLGCLFIGSVTNLGAILNFSDMMLLLMTGPNLIGCYLLSNVVAADLDRYFHTLGGEKPAIAASVFAPPGDLTSEPEAS